MQLVSAAVCLACAAPRTTQAIRTRRCASLAAAASEHLVGPHIVGTHDYTCIAKGQVFAAPNWLSDELVQALRSDVRALLSEGSVPDTDEPIGKRQKLELDTSNWAAPDEATPSAARAAARRQIDALRRELERVVGRPLYMDALGSQAKYSIGKRGEPIALHLDARHEAFAARFYGQERTRRSLAWLLYLGDDDWGRPGGGGLGGTLRAYPRAPCTAPGAKAGWHEGNLQVGWLERGRGSEPVFLDCWCVPDALQRGGGSLAALRRRLAAEIEDEAALWSALFAAQPAYQLYAVGADGSREPLGDAHEAPPRDAASGEWLADAPPLRQLLPPALQGGFSSTLAEHPAQRPMEVSPRGGTLVVFEACVVPHEVTPVVHGERLALFGFFAEERRVPPAWQDPEGEDSACGAWFHDGWAHTDC